MHSTLFCTQWNHTLGSLLSRLNRTFDQQTAACSQSCNTAQTPQPTSSKLIQYSTQGGLRPLDNQQGRRLDLQPHLRSRPAETRQQRLPHPRRHLPWHTRHLSIDQPCPSSSRPSARCPQTSDYRHRKHGKQSFPIDVLSDSDWCQVLAIHQSGATEHGCSRAAVLRSIRRFRDEESILLDRNAHTRGEVRSCTG